VFGGLALGGQCVEALGGMAVLLGGVWVGAEYAATPATPSTRPVSAA
jgi:hypothetical protein